MATETPFPFPLLPTAIGSMPHKDAHEATGLVVKALPQLPAWPQLPNRSILEHMAAQFLSEVPSKTITTDAFLVDELPEGPVGSAIGPQRVPGLYALLNQAPKDVRGLKGQITGPITLAALVRLEGGVRAIESKTAREWLASHLGSVAVWQENLLKQRAPKTLIFLDEPYLLQALSEQWISVETAHNLITTSAQGLTGLTGLHCCASPPWEMLVELPLDVLSFDAYHYGDSAVAAAASIKSFLSKGGAIAWGVIPADPFVLADASLYRVSTVINELWGSLKEHGVPLELLSRQSIITPVCGLAGVNPDEAVRALDMTRQLATELRIMMSQQLSHQSP